MVPVLGILLITSGRFFIGQVVIQFADYIILALLTLLVVSLRSMSSAALLHRIIISAIIIVFMLWGPLHITRAESQLSTDGSKQLITWNLRVKNDNYRSIEELIGDAPHSILCAQETDSAKASMLSSDYLEHLTYPQSDPFGNSMYSNDSVLSREVFNINSRGQVMLRLTLRSGAQNYSVYSVHVPPPLSATSFEEQKESLIRIAQITGKDTLPKILCGDFNLTVYSTLFQDFLYRTDLAKVTLRGILARTWRLGFIPLLELDHVLISEGIQVHSLQGLSYKSSDHRALRLSYSVSP